MRRAYRIKHCGSKLFFEFAGNPSANIPQDGIPNQHLRLVEYDGDLYLGWSDGARIRVARYNENPDTWNFVDGGTENGLQIRPGEGMNWGNLDFLASDRNLYLIHNSKLGGYGATDQIRVDVFR